MRQVDQNMLNHLEQNSMTLCYMVAIETKDGNIIRFNTSDKDIKLVFDILLFNKVVEEDNFDDIDKFLNVTYYSGGYSPSAFSAEETNSVQKMEIKGLLSSIEDNDNKNSFKYELAMNNYYQGANVYIAIADYEFDSGVYYNGYMNYYNAFVGFPHIKLARANIGNITIRNFDTIEIELRGFNQKLNNKIEYSYSRSCRATLYDNKCGLDRNNFEVNTVIDSKVNELTYRIPAISGQDPLRYKNGSVILRSGLGVGQKGILRGCRSVIIDDNEYFEFELRRNIPGEIIAGDTISIYMGCDKSLGNCKLFNNVDNFRGEPYIPGDEVFNIQGIGN